MANPTISPHLHYYPEDAGDKLSETWQGKRWLRELDSTLASQMIRIAHQDYYVHEPAKLVDGTVVMPVRWFTRAVGSGMGSQTRQVYWAEVWHLQPVASDEGYVGYVVHEYDTVEIPAHSLLLSMPQMVETFASESLPDPHTIIGMCSIKLYYVVRLLMFMEIGTIKSRGCSICPWRLTNSILSNRWRALAKGHRVVTFMIWLYCGDTSGNLSKKWNKHNSFLFTPAGLPRHMVHRQSNIHFLSTSNLAPPLEMLDGIASQLE